MIICLKKTKKIVKKTPVVLHLDDSNKEIQGNLR
jgi:hypothetical protein